MTISMYAASVPVMKHMLGNLSHILDKGAAHAESKKFEPANLVGYRLAPDMLPLYVQVYIACDAAKIGIARISGVEAPKFEDKKDPSFAEMKERIQKTIEFLSTVPAAKLDGTEEKDITFPTGGAQRTMKAQAYLTTWCLANMFFHITMTYAILRHNGVELGKADYLAGAKA
jgi:uncharacterized protein